MWETLAKTRRQDQVLHGTARIVGIVIGLIGVPLWLLGQRLTRPFRRLLAWFDSSPQALPVPPPRERTMDALMAELEAIPSRLRPRRSAQLRKGIPDLVSFVLTQQREAANLGYSYPRQFRDHRFESLDGESIGASVAMHDVPRPGLVVVHGTYSTRRFDYVRDIAVRAYYDWGFNVAAIDLRSFGLTELYTRAVNTGGWKEGEDVIAAARYLKELGASSIGAIGISLGGSAVLNASHPEGAEILNGGILAVSPPADVRQATVRLARPLPIKHPDYAMNLGFRAMLVSRLRSGRFPASQIRTIPDFMEKVAAPSYGVTPEELWRRTSAVNNIGAAAVPVLVLHPVDDGIVPVEHARMLDKAAAGNDWVRVWMLPGGAHGATDAIDRDWTFAVYRAFFERWAEYPARPEAEMVYSGQDGGKVKVDG